MAPATLVRPCTSALFITAPASGQGKTTVTAALARFHRNHGRRVRVFKTGPDFLDPMLLEHASGAPVYQLDLWMGGAGHCRQLLHAAACEADLILIEGVMGLYDGAPSSADLARTFSVPLLAVIDSSALAQTFGAIAHGLATFRQGCALTHVVANRVAGERHAAMLAESLPPGIALAGWLPRDDDITLPERHLGLVQARELPDLEARLDRAAARWAEHGSTALPPPVAFDIEPAASCVRILNGTRIAVAKDDAFAFIYPANLDVLRTLGAELVFFSPLVGDSLPACHSVYLPGGYPELHGPALARNQALLDSLRVHHAAAKPIVAECGGMLYLLNTLIDVAGNRHTMAGLLPGTARMQSQLAAIALQQISLPEGMLRGHTFHFSTLDTPLIPLTKAICPNGNATSEAVFRERRLTASYMHLYFPSNPAAVGQLFAP